MVLDETGLITRYYLPPADVRSELLEPSETFTECPYKGRCDYWSVRAADGALYADAAWCYARPLPDVGAIAGHLCFWQEREDTVIRIDGEVLPRPLGTPGGDGVEALPPWRARHVMPPPESMRGVPAGSSSATGRARTTAPRARRTASWTWPTSAPAGPRLWRYERRAPRSVHPRNAARRVKLSFMPSFMPVSSAASRAAFVG